MKLKNTLSVVIGSLIAASSIGAMAQGQGAVEVDAFAKYYEPDTQTGLDEGALYGAGIGYFLTDDVSLNLSHGVYDGVGAVSGSKNIEGELTSLDAAYHFGTPGVGLRPYVSAGAAHQSIGQPDRSGRDHQHLRQYRCWPEVLLHREPVRQGERGRHAQHRPRRL